MITRKFRTILIASILVLINISFTLSAEDAPAIGKDEGLFKINFNLPEGMVSPPEKYSFMLYAIPQGSTLENENPVRCVIIEPNSSNVTVYVPIKIPGGKDSANYKICYIPLDMPGFTSGVANDKYCSVDDKNYFFNIKAGEVSTITLELLQGIKVSGLIEVPASAKPGKYLSIRFFSGSPTALNYSANTISRVIDPKAKIPYSVYLPKDMDFGIEVLDLFGKNISGIESNVLHTSQNGGDGIVKNFQIRDLQPISFIESDIEAQVREQLKKPTGQLYEYMLNGVNTLIIWGNKVKSLADLAYFKRINILVITKCNNFESYSEIIGRMQSIENLYIGETPLKDLSFISNLQNLKRLTLYEDRLTDISTLSKMKYLPYLSLADSGLKNSSSIANISQLTTLILTIKPGEDLSYLKKCSSLEDLEINANWNKVDFSFVKSLTKLKKLSLLKVSVYSDLSVLENPGTDVKVVTDSGNDPETPAFMWGPESLKLHIALNNKVRQILEKIIKPGMSDIEKELAIHDYIATNTRYDYDTLNMKIKSDNMASSAYGSLINNLAMCGGYSNAFYLLMNSVGVECRLVYGKAKVFDVFENHGWNIVKLDGEYYMVDTTWAAPKTADAAAISYNYFNCTSQEWRAVRQWDETKYPECTGTKYRYAAYNRKEPTPIAVIPVVIPDKPKEVITPKEKTSREASSRPFVMVYAGPVVSPYSNYYPKEKTAFDFQIATYEVTQASWKALMGKNPSTRKGDTLPVENVSWLDSITYCNKLSQKERLKPYYTIDTRKKTVTRNPKSSGYRLPTDLEWEYAATGGEKSKSMAYSGGEDGVVVNSSAIAVGGSKGGNELGICDMSGNVAEWCWDAETDLKDTISFPKESYSITSTHLFRGGSYNSGLKNTGINYRVRSAVESKQTIKGLRLARNKN